VESFSGHISGVEKLDLIERVASEMKRDHVEGRSRPFGFR
jgi:hypothetical protein